MRNYRTTNGRLQPATLRSMSDVEAAYVGAMFDAEGCLFYKDAGVPLLSLINSEVEIISALLRFTGVGTVNFAKPVKTFYKACYMWRVAQQNNARALFERIAPFSVKAQLALESVQV